MPKHTGKGGSPSEGVPEAQMGEAKQDSVIAFYGHRQGAPYREFSNFYEHGQPFEFFMPSFAHRDGLPMSIWCAFSEKAIMACKAALMGDLKVFKEIAAVDNPKDCKSLGRSVHNFDDKLWNLHLEDVAFEVVKQKFASEKTLRQLLLSTGDTILVEAAPNDRIWGIGLPVSDPRVNDPAQWRGRNILGSALMRARDHLRAAGTTAASSVCSAAETAARAEENSTALSSSSGVAAKDVPVDAGNQAPEKGSRTRRWGAAGSKENRTDLRDPDGSESPPISQAAPTSASSAAEIFDCFVVLDFEATCDDGKQIEPQEVIEFPIVLIQASTGRKMSEFRTYVQPVHHPQLTAFCMQLTGIKQNDVDAAPLWSDALAQVQEWLDGQLQELQLYSCLFVTCGDWDLQSMMGRQCAIAGTHVPARFRQWLNIKNFFRNVTGMGGGGMKSMLDSLRLRLEGHHHSGLDDSRNIARILQELLRRGGSVQMDMISTLTAGKATKGAGYGSKGAGKAGNSSGKKTS